ncbi:MAG: TPM domain-containing protein [Pyrinomonadaceae bacterium]
MKLFSHENRRTLVFGYSVLFLFLSAANHLAQTKSQIRKGTGHVNDSAGVLDRKTLLELEGVLDNLKNKTGIEFGIATVDSTGGQEIFDFSRQLALDWDVGARNSRTKSLLLVVSINDRTSFTQFSRSVQSDLPEGVLGEIGQRMRSPVASGQFSEGLKAGVEHFVNSIANKLGLNAADFYKGTASVPRPGPSPGRTSTSISNVEPAASSTRPRITRMEVTSPAARNEHVLSNKRRDTPTDDDAAESEEVELTLTLPLEARISKLRTFVNEHPDSKSRERATELLVSARAGLGDERLKRGDTTGGTEQLIQAIVDAPVNASDKLFSGVVSQIPLNLYMRGERAAATKAAQALEAKFGNDAKRLLAISGFYVATEQGSEATRLATQAVALAPDMAEAHQVLGRALHISLRLEDAAIEYQRALELNPTSKSARRSLADLRRAFGKSEEALSLYRQQLAAEPTDKPSRAGLILSLLELGRTDEAKTELEQALKTDPQNLALLTGAAYWFAAHNDYELALNLASKAVAIEPRYTWAQVALGRALMGRKRPLEAERALRFARQYGKFPTLDYELATILAGAGLYDEATELLTQSFVVRDDQIETRLAGREPARRPSFIELLAPERRASIFQSAAADSENNARILKALLTLAANLNQENATTINEASSVAAAKEFASGDDAARVYRQLYAASRLLQKGIAFQTVYELAESARNTADAGMTVPAVTVAVQADELRPIRARAISSGGTPDIPDAPRNVLSNLLRGRIEDLSGWALFNQDRLDEAVDHLKRAASILPEGTPALRTAMWHLGAALEQQDEKEEALTYYIKSYNAGEPDPVRRTLIEQLYRKIHGSLDGLEKRIESAPTAATSMQTPPREANTSTATEPTTASSPNVDVKSAAPSATALPEVPSAAIAQPTSSEIAAATVPQQTSNSPASSTSSSPELTTEATPRPTPETSPITSALASPVETVAKPPAVIRITGRVSDANNNPIANVVVVLISPQGTVLASTTDDQGNYSFSVAPSSHSYRLIPSRDGFAFEPVDRVLPSVSADQKAMDFVGVTRNRKINPAQQRGHAISPDVRVGKISRVPSLRSQMIRGMTSAATCSTISFTAVLNSPDASLWNN